MGGARPRCVRRCRSATRFPFLRTPFERNAPPDSLVRVRPGNASFPRPRRRPRVPACLLSLRPGASRAPQRPREVGPGRGRLSEGAGWWLVGGRDSFNCWHNLVRDRSLPRAPSRPPGSREPGHADKAAAQKFWRRAGLPGAERARSPPRGGLAPGTYGRSPLARAATPWWFGSRVLL